MKEYQVGDILIDVKQWPGHVGMVYELTKTYPKIVHAQAKPGFHIESQQQRNDNGFSYLFEGANIHRPPWDKLNEKQRAAKQAEIKRIADGIVKYSQYGIYRAVRLFVGDSSHGDKAKKRLTKYRNRLNSNFAGGKFVSKVTCAESVVLCYQLAFPEGPSDFWLDKDAAHVMPRTLDAYLQSLGSWKSFK